VTIPEGGVVPHIHEVCILNKFFFFSNVLFFMCVGLASE